MTNIRHQKNYKAYYIPQNNKKINVFLGVAFEIEKPVKMVFKSFWNVITSPVELKGGAS